MKRIVFAAAVCLFGVCARGGAGKYIAIDISGGPNAARYPVENIENETFTGAPGSPEFRITWSDQYRTTKILLRRCPKGRDPLNRYEITRDFYAGVFEITQKQWKLVMGEDPVTVDEDDCDWGTGDKNPVFNVSFGQIRGRCLGAQWPAHSQVDYNSFIGKLRAKTGLNTLDLPTDAQWEYAARAGWTGDYSENPGQDELPVSDYAWYEQTVGADDVQTQPVGTKINNRWGLFDTAGNVFEWCLDWGEEGTNADFSPFADPTGQTSGTSRIRRGGSCSGDNTEVLLNPRSSNSALGPSEQSVDTGFRLFMHAAEPASAPGPNKYLVIDISGGTAAETFPVTELADIPSTGWTDEYKTNKIVFRRCAKGQDALGRYTLSKDFYAAVFEITRRQWELVTGSAPAPGAGGGTGATLPASNISWASLRGAAYLSNWPQIGGVNDSSSFIGILQRKTGLNGSSGLTLDLPTVAQWDYACRAGLAVPSSQSDPIPEIGFMAWNASNASNALHAVGTKDPNAWGLHDTLGNVAEWCLDFAYPSLYGTDPQSAASMSYDQPRTLCGGSCETPPPTCTPFAQTGSAAGTAASTAGARLFITVAESATGGGGATVPPLPLIPGLPQSPTVADIVTLLNGETMPVIPPPFSLPKYLVIDVSGGTANSEFGFEILNAEPEGGWTDEYKTDKIVLRHCPRGRDPKGRYKLTRDFYAGVFEMTQAQWEKVTGFNPSKTVAPTNPVANVSYAMVRGPAEGQQWPESSAVDGSSFIGIMRAKTGLYGFDLPTDAQWEYACRAGTTTRFNNGLDILSPDIGWGMNNSKRKLKPVGLLTPNSWGLYDMHGNVQEFCLDWMLPQSTQVQYLGNYDYVRLQGRDPVGDIYHLVMHDNTFLAASKNIARGGTYAFAQGALESDCWNEATDGHNTQGLRLFLTLPPPPEAQIASVAITEFTARIPVNDSEIVQLLVDVVPVPNTGDVNETKLKVQYQNFLNGEWEDLPTTVTELDEGILLEVVNPKPLRRTRFFRAVYVP